MDKDQLLHVDGVDYLLRHPEVTWEGDKGRLAGLNATLTGGFTDDIIENVPAAIAALVNRGDSNEANELLKDLARRHRKEWKKRNYGFDIQGHHPVAVGSSHLLASDMSMKDAQKVYSIGRLNGVEHGTKDSYMLPLTKLGHHIAHIDPITHKTNKSRFQGDNTLFRQADPEARAMAALPLNLLEQTLSKSAFHSPQEKEVRRFAASLVGITPEQLISFKRNPNYFTDTGREGKVSYVGSAKKALGEAEMARAIISGYGSAFVMEDVVKPNQYMKTYAKKSPQLVDRVSPTEAHILHAMSKFRPGQKANVDRLLRGRK